MEQLDDLDMKLKLYPTRELWCLKLFGAVAGWQ